jgi:hypothetical protein
MSHCTDEEKVHSGDAASVRYMDRGARPLVVVAIAAAFLAAAGGFAALAGIHFGGVDGAPKPAVTGFLIPPPAPGRPVAVVGDGAQRLPEAKAGEYTDYIYDDAHLQWRLDSFDDSDALGATLAGLGDAGRDGYHWALVRYTERAATDLAGTPDLNAYVFLIDDRGLTLSAASSFLGPVNSEQVNLPADCPQVGVAPAPAGTEFATCAVFSVPDDMPITSVAVSDRANARPLSTSDPGVLKNGARIPVTARAPGGGPPDLTTNEPNTFVAMRGPDFAGDVAVVGLVTDVSGYLDKRTTPILTGTRTVILRLAVRPGKAADTGDLADLGAALLDERGTPIDPAISIGTNECADIRAGSPIEGTVARCVLFVVPTGAKPTAAAVRVGIGALQLWRL